MKKRIAIYFSLVVILVSTSAFVISSNGMIGRTGSPGETTCLACHSGGAGTFTSISIIASPSFIANKYIPGQTYTIDIVVANSSYSLFGFNCEILDSTNSDAGIISSPGFGVKLLPFAGKTNATHMFPQFGSGTATFSFVWIAPSAGNATIYTSGNAVNGDGTPFGDRSSSSSLVLSGDLASEVNKSIDIVPTDFSVFPNPVVSDFTLSYNLKKEGNVKVFAYNMNGENIAEIVNEKQKRGQQHVHINSKPKSVSKGIYILELILEEETLEKRLIIFN